MTNVVQRDAAAQVSIGVYELARSATVSNLSPQERISRAMLAAEAGRAMRSLGPLLDPYASGEHSRVADTLTIARGKGDTAEATARVGLDRHARLAVSRDLQTSGDNPGILPEGRAPFPSQDRPPVPFLDALALPVTEITHILTVPLAWEAKPVGFVASETEDPYVPMAAITDAGRVPTAAAVGVIDVPDQVLKWGVNASAEYDRLVDRAASVALEAYLLAQLTAAAGVTVAAAAGELVDALDQAEAELDWYTGATHLVVNPTDWPAIRRAWAAAGMWPGPLLPIVTDAQAAGVALMFPASAVTVAATPTELEQIKKVPLGVTRIGAVRYGAAGAYSPAAVAAITLAPATPLATTRKAAAGHAA